VRENPAEAFAKGGNSDEQQDVIRDVGCLHLIYRRNTFLIIVKDHVKRVIFLTNHMTFLLATRLYFVQKYSRRLDEFDLAGILSHLQVGMWISENHLGYASPPAGAA
jgi:hypothetical protein